MDHKKFLGAGAAALMIVILVILLLAPAAGAASKYKVLHRFHGGANDGSAPFAGLILDAAGNLYGTTHDGGASNDGTVFKLTPNADGSWAESVLYSFIGGNDGANPWAGLIFDTAGDLYGTTNAGGASNFGTVFKLTPNADGSWTESVLHSFNGRDGYWPEAGLIFDAAGNLYGTTWHGGASDSGTVFKLTPNADGSWTQSVLHSFNGRDGANPEAGLIFDAAGNLYGTTLDGGGHNMGTVFKLTPNADGSWTQSVLRSFNGRDGFSITTGLIFDTVGNLYGTAPYGGSGCSSSGCGLVFELTPNADGSWTESVLHRFSGTPARYPNGLIFDGAGDLYGTAGACGSACGGAAFKLSPDLDGSWAYSLIHVFLGNPAWSPSGGLVLGSAGTLYGATAQCLSGCNGVVYQITP